MIINYKSTGRTVDLDMWPTLQVLILFGSERLRVLKFFSSMVEENIISKNVFNSLRHVMKP